MATAPVAPTYTPISGVAADTTSAAFDPSNPGNFYNNFNNMAVDYSASLTPDQQRYNDLVAAYQYASNPANQATLDQENYAGYSQYVLSQLTQDLTEQQNLVNYATDQGQASQYASQLSGMQNDYNSTQGSQGANHTDTSQWPLVQNYAQSLIQLAQSNSGFMNSMESRLGLPQENPQSAARVIAYFNNIKSQPTNNNPLVTQGEIGQAIQLAEQGLQAKIGTNSTADSAAANAAVQGFTLNNPNYNQANQAVQNYYEGTGPNDPNSQIYQATKAADESIYNQVYNIKNQVNSQAAATGVSNSGERQAALSNVTGQGVQAATQLRNNAENQAQQSIQAEQKANAAAQSNQQDLVNQEKGSTIGNLFNTATGTEINAYNNQTNANNATNLANNETNLSQQEASTNMFNNIFGQSGSALGSLAGNAATSGVPLI